MPTLLQSYFLQCKSGGQKPSEQPARNGLRYFIPFQLKTMKLLHRKMSDDIFQQLELSIVFSRPYCWVIGSSCSRCVQALPDCPPNYRKGSVTVRSSVDDWRRWDRVTQQWLSCFLKMLVLYPCVRAVLTVAHSER